MQVFSNTFLTIVIAFAMLWSRAAHPAADCLTEPNLKVRDGGHWYYRIDVVNHRKCWFIGQSGMEIHRPAASKTQAIPIPASRPSVSLPPGRIVAYRQADVLLSPFRGLPIELAAYALGLKPLSSIHVAAAEPDLETSFNDEPPLVGPATVFAGWRLFPCAIGLMRIPAW